MQSISISRLQTNTIYQELLKLNIITADSVSDYYPTVRDRADVGAVQCSNSGVIFLDRVDHIQDVYYAEKSGTSYWNSSNRNEGLKSTWEDDNRRIEQIRHLITNKVFLDIGTGLGGILDLALPFAKEIHAVEPQQEINTILKSLNYQTHLSIESLPSCGTQFDIVTLFHVFEHLSTPLESLTHIHKSMAQGGKLIIEVPHAQDALLADYDLDAFKKFTLWSEHLILHTHKSLETYLKAAGFKNIHIQGYQRYPLANHLYWLSKGLPGGHNELAHLRNPTLEKEYAAVLGNLNRTDTLFAIAEKIE